MKGAIVVTGAGTGLGLETSLHLAEQGWQVYATIPVWSQQEAVARAAAERGVSLRILELDITQDGSIDAALEIVLAESGSIYGLVNNAAIALRGYFEDLEEDELRRIFEVNVFGTMKVTRAVLPHMRRAGRGRIIIITSVGGRLASLAVSAYCSTKFAQEGFGEALAQEVLPFGIYVSLVEPAMIATERFGENRGYARHAFNEASPYAAWFRRSQVLTDRLVRSSPTRPHHIAETVGTILSAQRPHLRYLVGTRARLLFLLRRLLPFGLFDRIYFAQAIRQVTGGRAPLAEDS